MFERVSLGKTDTQKIIVVGAGFFGAVMAERIANLLKLPVTVIERRKHPGGNSWSEIDAATGVECHCYGSHIFHTSNEEVWNYISQFTEWNDYRHHVWARCRERVYAMPINLHTISSWYGKDFSPDEAKAFIGREAAGENIGEPKNLEEKAITQIGRPLYEAFIRGYTLKQWEKDPRELDASIITRLPVRFNYNNRYFSDKWEGIPLNGYGRLFEELLSSPLIDLRLSADWRDVREHIPSDALIIFSGAIDSFFDFKLGCLEWRTLDFEIDRPPCSDFQGAPVVNSVDAEIPYTRTHEFKHYHPEREDTGKTIIYREYSRKAQKGDEPYYAISTSANRQLYSEYENLARKTPNVIFGGRLGKYAYFDMDDAIAAALECFNHICASGRLKTLGYKL